MIRRSFSGLPLLVLTTLLAVAAFSACEGTSPEEVDAGQPVTDAGTHDAGEPDAGEIDAGPTDAGPTDAGELEPDGIECGAVHCEPGELCCVDNTGGVLTGSCAATCPGPTLACDGPEDCGGLGGHCCGEMQTGAGTVPNCPIDALSSTCAASCTTSLKLTSCSSTSTIQLCHLNADCSDAGGGNSQCCTFTDGANDSSFCVSALVKSLAAKVIKGCAAD